MYMTTMSDDGEKTCPLCAEEMDLTDQQLKPCKCGYEICVWCWNHIIEMAEKEDAEGRCPACRTPYDKERIVGMAASCERVVAEVSTDKKTKPQRAKTKTSVDARKHLNDVRVIKRNLVYIIGLPNNLADESILERKEYFGQYGKVLKLSISRQTNTASAAPPSNGSTFGVYITYAREEEAIRCIQVVNNFVLEGNPLRAYFGTTKYCHIWLRNMTCTNPHCLYLHDVDSQEDSLTKDELLSDYTRSKVPESCLSNLQQRSGHILPPPVDETSNSGAVSWKHILKNTSNNTSVQVKGSNSFISCGKSPVLPAAASWGSRVSNCRPPVPSTASSQNPVKQKVDVVSDLCRLSSTDTSTKQTSSSHDKASVSSKIPREYTAHTKNKSRSVESIKPGISSDSKITASNVSSEALVDGTHVPKISSWDDDIMTFKFPEGVHEEISFRTIETLRSGDRDNNAPIDVSMENVIDDACRSAWDDDEVTITQVPEGRKTTQMDDNDRPSDPVKPSTDRDHSTSVLDMSLKIVTDASYTAETLLRWPSSPSACVTEPKDENIAVLGDNINLLNNMSPETSERGLSGPVPDEVAKACLGLASVNLDDRLLVDRSNIDQYKKSVSTDMHKNLGSSLRNYYPEHDIGYIASASFGRTSNPDAYNSRGLSDRNLDQQVHVLASNGTVTEDSLLGSDDRNQRLSPITDKPSCFTNGHCPVDMLTLSSNTFWTDKVDDSCLLFNGYARTLEAVDMKLSSFGENGPALNLPKEEPSNSVSQKENGPALNAPKEEPSNSVSQKEAKFLGRSNGVSNIGKIASVDMGESSIITDILSMDFDPWDVSLSSANNFAKLLGVIDEQDGPSKLPSSRKLQNSNQSRFSFARQENQSDIDTSITKTADTHRLFSSSEVTDSYHHIPQTNRYDASVNVPNGISAVSSDPMPGTVRGKFSAPPGFSVPSRAPPPGFSSHNKYGSSYETSSENRMLGHSSLSNQYQVQSSEIASDVEFIDPAILAVGKGILPLGVNNSGFGSRYALPTQFSDSNNDLKLHLKQQAIAAHQDMRVSEHIGERFLPLNDAYISSRHLAQTHMQSPFAQMSQQPSGSHILGGQWDVWNGTSMINDTRMTEVLRNERFGLVNGYAPYNGEHKFYRPTSGGLYNRALGRSWSLTVNYCFITKSKLTASTRLKAGNMAQWNFYEQFG